MLKILDPDPALDFDRDPDLIGIEASLRILIGILIKVSGIRISISKLSEAAKKSTNGKAI